MKTESSDRIIPIPDILFKQSLKKDRNMRRIDGEESMINTIRSLMGIMCAVPPMENQEVRISIGYISRNY